MTPFESNRNGPKYVLKVANPEESLERLIFNIAF